MALTLTHNSNKQPHWGNKPLCTVAGSRSFSAMLYEMFSEQRPNVQKLELFELLLKLSIDHGPGTPSAKATIAAAEKGLSMGEAVGDGMHIISGAHGGAGEPAMRLFYDIAQGKREAKEAVAIFIAEKKRLPGFGHRLYEKDPRAELIMDTVIRLEFPKTYFKTAREIESALATQLPKKKLSLNIDGAIGVVLCTLGWKPETSTALFITARSAGLCAHYLNTVQ